MIKIKLRRINKYKYELLEDYYIQTDLRPRQNRIGANNFVELHINGVLLIKRGYCFDGTSGPTWDTETTMRAGLVHDVMDQLMREGKIWFGNVDYADKLFRQILLEDGTNKFRAWYYFKGVSNWFAHRSAKPTKK